jgi:hypothetical protein
LRRRTGRERGSGGRAGEREREQRWPRGEEQQGFVRERCWVKTMLGPALDGVGAGGGALGGGSRLEESCSHGGSVPAPLHFFLLPILYISDLFMQLILYFDLVVLQK